MSAGVIIIGGGISGLSCAWFLQQQGVAVRVLESRSQPGGTILTSRADGFQVEHGPNSTLQKPGHPEDALGRLIAGLDLTDRLQTANSQAAVRYILKQGSLMPLPSSPLDFLRTPIFSARAKWRLLAEPFIGRADTEESIADFVRRRLGAEFLDYAIEPFISGVYAGDPERLSVQAAVARIYALEAKHRSLILGAIAQGRVSRGAGLPKGRMIAFAGGMQTLPAAIADSLPPGCLQTGAEVYRLEQTGDGWKVRWRSAEGQEQEEQAARVILAIPAPMTATLLKPFCPGGAQILRSIPYAPIVSTALGYRREQVAHPLDGFGFLIPRQERVRLLGALFSSTLFPGRVPSGRVLITTFIGGAMDPEILALDDAGLLKQVEGDLGACLGIRGRAGHVRITRYRASIPQYVLGHNQRIEKLDALISRTPGLHLRANWRDGISVADCVRNGELLAQRLTAN